MADLKFTTEKVHDGYMRVNSCGLQSLGDRDYNTVREKGRVDFSIHYVSRGQGGCYVNGQKVLIPAGSLVLHFPGVAHHYFFKKEDDSQILWAHFSGSACQVLQELPGDRPVVQAVGDRKQFESVFGKMIAAYNNRLTAGQLLCDAYMPVLLALLVQTDSASLPSRTRDPRLEDVITRMQVNLNKPIDIRAYAQLCHLSEDRFIRAFKDYTGLPPYRYQLKMRITRAVEMLENTGISVAECGETVGFADNAYFCRIFKKFTGHPPSYYRKR